MDGIDFVRQIARLRAEAQARTRFAVLWQSELATTEATAADCLECAKEPLRRLDALRRRPGPDPLVRADRSRRGRPGRAAP